MKIKRETLLRIIFNYVAFILVCIMNVIFRIAYPNLSTIGLSNAQWFNLSVIKGMIVIPLVYGALVSLVCVYWMIKLRPMAGVLSGIIIGAHFTLIFIPYEMRKLLEEALLPVPPPFLLYIFFYAVLVIGVPILVFEATNRLVIFLKKTWDSGL